MAMTTRQSRRPNRNEFNGAAFKEIAQHLMSALEFYADHAHWEGRQPAVVSDRGHQARRVVRDLKAKYPSIFAAMFGKISHIAGDTNTPLWSKHQVDLVMRRICEYSAGLTGEHWQQAIHIMYVASNLKGLSAQCVWLLEVREAGVLPDVLFAPLGDPHAPLPPMWHES